MWSVTIKSYYAECHYAECRGVIAASTCSDRQLDISAFWCVRMSPHLPTILTHYTTNVAGA